MTTYTTRSYLSAARKSANVKALIKGYPSALFRRYSFLLPPLKSQSFKAPNIGFSKIIGLSLPLSRGKFSSGNAIDHKEFTSNFIGETFKFGIRTSSDYSLADAFGANAWQDENWLVIDKGDLGFIGELSIEQFLIALILRWSNLFEPDRRIRCQYWRSIPVFFQGQWWDKHSFLIYLLAINSPNFPSPHSFLV